ncbi:MAG: hypothetical protein RIS75_481, partial [Actinomycetota bacterium]
NDDAAFAVLVQTAKAALPADAK